MNEENSMSIIGSKKRIPESVENDFTENRHTVRQSRKT
jgi:hypothetical protein